MKYVHLLENAYLFKPWNHIVYYHCNFCFTLIFKLHLIFNHSNYQKPSFAKIASKRNVQSNVEIESYLEVAVYAVSD